MESRNEPESVTGDENFSYRELSQLSEATDDVYAESVGEAAGADLKDYNRLVQQTQQKLSIMSKYQSLASNLVGIRWGWQRA